VIPAADVPVSAAVNRLPRARLIPDHTARAAAWTPTPIACPGRTSLKAVLHPDATNALYFVADGTGGHVFAETYEQHQKNVARLRLIETDQNDQAPIDAPAAATPAQPSSGTPLRGTSKQRSQATH